MWALPSTRTSPYPPHPSGSAASVASLHTRSASLSSFPFSLPYVVCAMLIFSLHTPGHSQCYISFADFTATPFSHVHALDLWRHLFVLRALHSRPAYPLWLHRHVWMRVFTILFNMTGVHWYHPHTHSVTASLLQPTHLHSLCDACVFADVVLWCCCSFVCICGLYPPPRVSEALYILLLSTYLLSSCTHCILSSPRDASYALLETFSYTHHPLHSSTSLHYCTAFPYVCEKVTGKKILNMTQDEA